MRFLAMAAILCLSLAACSTKKTVYSNNGTTVTSDTGGKTVTVESSGGSMTMGKTAVDLSKLGVPVYPGATQTESGGLSYAGTNGSGQMTSLITGDDFDKVYEWYKAHLPAGSEKMKSSGAGSSVAEFVVGDGQKGGIQTMVMITTKANQTSIVLSKGTSH